MKKAISFLSVLLISSAAIAATPAPDRRSMASQWMSSPRAGVASQNEINKSSIKAVAPATPSVPVNNRDAERNACIGNNIGVGNTFVWASKYSNTNDYTTMIEDTENPENNVCFVRIELRSADPKVTVSDVRPVYYQMGRSIVCGAWAPEDKIKERILDSKKSARTWGTVAGAVGGAGVGVGAMELFGNKLIGGSVQGQKSLNNTDLLRSQMIVAKEKDNASYQKVRSELQNLKNACDNFAKEYKDKELPPDCSSLDYDLLLLI